MNEAAVNLVFLSKGRPLTDPLIVHVLDSSAAIPLIELSKGEEDIFRVLTAAFWPGPLTLIVKASSLIPPSVTAHTGYVGVRAPSHPLARELLAASGLPIAAPSANRFGHVSPTKASHVLDDLGAKGVRVLHGEAKEASRGSCQFGIESTVLKIDGTCGVLTIFRHGAVTQPQIERAIVGSGQQGWTLTTVNRAVSMTHSQSQSERRKDSSEEEPRKASESGQEAPGQAITHYSPDLPCVVVDSVSSTRGSTVSASTKTLSLSSRELQTGCVIIDFGQFLGALADQVSLSSHCRRCTPL